MGQLLIVSRVSGTISFRNYNSGDRGSTVVKVLAKNRKVACSIPDGVSGFFVDIKSFRSHNVPGVDSAPNRIEYQEHFQG